LSFSSDGKIAYSISDSFNANGPGFGGASSIIISRSTDGGNTWQTPVTARLDTSVTVLNDKESVTADPRLAHPTDAYAVWDRLVSPSTNANPSAFLQSPAFRGPTLFSRTADGGVTWSPGRIIFDPGQNSQTIGNQIVVPQAGPASGELIDGFDLFLHNGGGNGKHGRFTVSPAIIRSTDGGNTWSRATVIAQQQLAEVAINGRTLRTGDTLPAYAAGPEGNLYAVWQDGRFSPTGNAKVAFSMSTDGGATWSTPVRVDQSVGNAPAFTPQITVSPSGTVAVEYYDLENATAAQPDLTDAFLVTCSSNCANRAGWSSESRLSSTGSFNI
jgi:Neuraminidase (sialidase)